MCAVANIKCTVTNLKVCITFCLLTEVISFLILKFLVI